MRLLSEKQKHGQEIHTHKGLIELRKEEAEWVAQEHLKEGIGAKAAKEVTIKAEEEAREAVKEHNADFHGKTKQNTRILEMSPRVYLRLYLS